MQKVPTRYIRKDILVKNRRQFFERRQNLCEDGVEYEISKVKDIRRAASLKAGGAGMRYTCVVDGKEVYLFYEDNNMWFMEKSA